jgi:hypothetical protein
MINSLLKGVKTTIVVMTTIVTVYNDPLYKIYRALVTDFILALSK